MQKFIVAAGFIILGVYLVVSIILGPMKTNSDTLNTEMNTNVGKITTTNPN